MASTYQVIPLNPETGNNEVVVRTDDNGQVWWIPADPANSDYQAYLAYVANGNKVPSNSADPVEKPKK